MSRRTAVLFVISAVLWALLLVQVDRTDRHLEIREASRSQVAAVSFGMVGAAAAVQLASQYGPWSWMASIRRYGKDVAVALLALAFVSGLYLVSMLFR